ncbi:META domain-containing protein [Emticicia sp. 21SJ11W-3]|uniref:META domain-containing protein n=1 Tax=Emticicia sp. 21SJ11W-3 TaxID=2916755 RepID=UPI0020A0F88C|nr:META domain-containing protein [Emticicia sp. 21SJ11W-3]UTA66242.1 META domain-containing protein [Emticicia sp. 21SJ11W-3]
MKNLIIAICLSGLSVAGCVPARPTGSTPKQTSEALNAPLKLNGMWELAEIPGARVSVAGLYPDKKPTINFDVNDNKFTGNTSCNSFSGLLVAYGNKITFNKSMAMTKMACQGDGETTFLESLKKVDSYTVNANNTLSLNAGGVEVLRMAKPVR